MVNSFKSRIDRKGWYASGRGHSVIESRSCPMGAGHRWVATWPDHNSYQMEKKEVNRNKYSYGRSSFKSNP